MIYLDNAATTQMSPGVLEVVTKAMQEDYGNPGTLYDLGKHARASVENARKQVADVIGAQDRQIVFTSGGSESNATVFFGIADWMKKNMKNTVVVSAIEHESVLRSAEAVCMKYGFHLYKIAVDASGCVNVQQLQDILNRESVGLVSVMYMNNEIGTVQPNMNRIINLCRERGAFFHTDCVQALGSIPIDVSLLPCDFLSVSAHKIHGPKGVGALYVSDRVRHSGVLTPLIYGGQGQESGLRGGTENVPGIVGFGQACEEMKISMASGAAAKVFYLCERFIDRLKVEMEQCGLGGRLCINGDIQAGKICSVTITGIDNEALALLLDSNGICVGTGSACSSMEVTPSHVLKAIGLSDDAAMSTIRVSFCASNTHAEVSEAARKIAECCRLLMQLPEV